MRDPGSPGTCLPPCSSSRCSHCDPCQVPTETPEHRLDSKSLDDEGQPKYWGWWATVSSRPIVLMWEFWVPEAQPPSLLRTQQGCTAEVGDLLENLGSPRWLVHRICGCCLHRLNRLQSENTALKIMSDPGTKKKPLCQL